MYNKTAKRVISLILTLAMFITSLQTSAFALTAYALDNTENTAIGTETDTEYTIDTETNNSTSANVKLPEELNSTFETTVGEIINTNDGFRVQMNSDMESYCIISYIGSAKHVVIPTSYNGIPITRIGDSAFLRKNTIETVTIPTTIKSMGIDVFFDCENIAYNIYNGGKYLGNDANPYYYFVGPQNMDVESISVHADTCIIAAYAFRSCEKLKKVVIGDNIIQMGYGMVSECPSIESLTVPYVGEKKDNTRNAHFGLRCQMI